MSGSQPLHADLAQDLRTRINNGDWRPGSRLPSVRNLAAELGVSPVTVSRAFQILAASGHIETVHGKGTFVSATVDAPEDKPRDHSWQNALLRQPIPARANAIVAPLLRNYPAREDTIVLASGGETTDVVPPGTLQRLWRSLTDDQSAQLLGGWEPAGEPPLREWVADYLQRTGIDTDAGHILITNGGQQALSLAAQTLLQPDDTVLVERPMYPFAISIFESLGARCVDVPVGPNGMLVDAATDLMARFRPKMVFIGPTGQVPTGVTMPLPERRALLNAAERFGVIIIEDDHSSELSYDGPAPPAIKSYDRHGHVIYVKSFSKITLPALRIGCIVAEGPILDALIHGKLIADRYTSTLSQAALLKYVTSRSFLRNAERSRTAFRERRNAMLSALEELMPESVSWTSPASGFYLWVTLPEGISAQAVSRRAAANGVTIANGAPFFAQSDPDTSFRLTFSSVSVEQIEEGVRRLAHVISDMLGEPLTSSQRSGIPAVSGPADQD